MENFLLGLFRAEFLTNWAPFRGGVGVSYLEEGDSAADLGSNPGGVPYIAGSTSAACEFSLCSSGFVAVDVGFDMIAVGFAASASGVGLISGLGPSAVRCGPNDDGICPAGRWFGTDILGLRPNGFWF